MKEIKLTERETLAVLGILEGDASDPIQLISSVGLEPTTFFEFGDWRDVDFRNSNIMHTSFVGADLTNAIFSPEQVSVVEHRYGFPRERLRVMNKGEYKGSEVRERRSPNPNARLNIRLIGPFRLLSKDGEDLTPRSAKGRALLALLATAPEYSRGRKWLQEKLWSGRMAEQASSSLRQALLNIRRTLGEHQDVLQTDRNYVSLKVDAVAVDIDDPNPEVVSQTYEEAQLLEDLHINDPAFEDWLIGARREFDVDRSGNGEG